MYQYFNCLKHEKPFGSFVKLIKKNLMLLRKVSKNILRLSFKLRKELFNYIKVHFHN